MKYIVAIIRPEKLAAVRQELVDEEIFRITVSRCTGHGRPGDVELYRGQEIAPDLIPKVRLDIAVNDEFVEPTLAAISRAATTGDGSTGDGKIFVLPVDQVIRLSTSEQGSVAI